jgi:glycyl-tRNA synthetase beta chain
MANFLLEIGAEEIPDWMIEPALADLHTRFAAAFGMFGGSAITTDATPRRLVLQAKDLLPQAPDVESVVQGPYLSAGEKAAEGFAKKQNTTIDKLRKINDAKGERYIFNQLVKGQSAKQALSEKLPEIITGIHFPKTMYWTGKGGVRFIRPIRWIVALLDDQLVPFEIAGVKSSNTTRGHRVLGAKTPLLVGISNYVEVLRKNKVILSANERKQLIETHGLAFGMERDEDLLKTLAYLTEFPTVISGHFDESFLKLPREILSTVMRHHQRYFSVRLADGSLAPRFVAVSNTDGDPEGLIRQGNERVLRARFNDAKFFWEADNRKKLADRVADLEKVTFQAKLGTYKDKTERVRALAGQIAKALNADESTVDRAALLAKCDLTTDMVKEFTELQGVVGGLYAKEQGESVALADAIYDQYKPAGMEDSIPRSLEGQVVAIADKLDTLRECFRVGLIPTGSKDPFALRRATQGIVKILFDAKLPLQLMSFFDDLPELTTFMRDRIQFFLRDVKGFAYDEIKASMAPPIGNLDDLYELTLAFHQVRAIGDFDPLAASFKRIKNILTQARFEKARELKPELLVPGPEQELYEALLRVREQVRTSSTYREKLVYIASLRPQVDLFFDKILVNDPDPAIRENRLALLHSLLTEFSTIADFSEIVTQGASA